MRLYVCGGEFAKLSGSSLITGLHCSIVFKFLWLIIKTGFGNEVFWELLFLGAVDGVFDDLLFFTIGKVSYLA